MKQMITLQWFKTYIFEIWICFPFQTVKSDLCKILCVLWKFEYLEINQKICKKERKGSAFEQWQTKGGILRVAQAEQTQLLPFLAADYSSSLREGGNPSGESGKPTLTLKPFCCLWLQTEEHVGSSHSEADMKPSPASKQREMKPNKHGKPAHVGKLPSEEWLIPVTVKLKFEWLPHSCQCHYITQTSS